MEKQPNSRMCLVCGIDNPTGLDRGGRRPEDAALSIFSVIVAVNNGRSGHLLRDTAGWIGRWGRSACIPPTSSQDTQVNRESQRAARNWPTGKG